MKKVGMLSAVLFAVLGMVAVQAGFAATYKFIDKNGQVGFADDLQMVPEPYRATAVLISGEATEGQGNSASTAVPGKPVPALSGLNAQQAPATPAFVPAPSPAAQARPQPEKGLPFSLRLAVSIAVVIATILLSVFLDKVGALHGQARTIHILRVSLTWLVVIYLVAAHAKDVWTIFKVAGHQVQSVSAESAKKGEKAAKAIQALDAAMERAALQAQEAEKAAKEAEQGGQK
jgi:hypothetical protein